MDIFISLYYEFSSYKATQYTCGYLAFSRHAWEKGILETGVKMSTLCAAAAAVVSEKLSPPSRLVA